MKKRNVAFVVILSLITFGIYFLYWFYSTTKGVLAENKSEGSAVLWTIMMIIPFVQLYFLYKFLHENGKLLGFNGLVYWIISIVTFGIGGIVVIGLVQSKINAKYGGAEPAAEKGKPEKVQGKKLVKGGAKPEVKGAGVKSAQAKGTKPVQSSGKTGVKPVQQDKKDYKLAKKGRKGPAVYEF